MAKLLIEIEDSADGELRVNFTIDDVRTASTASTNTATQNIAIYLASHMRELGLQAPNLS